MKNSIVKSVQPNGTWDGNYGMMYKFEIGFENGDVGEYSSKNKDQDKFNIGQQTDYEYIGGKFPKVKPVYIKPESFNKSFNNSVNENPDRQKLIVRQSSLKSAVEYNSNCSADEVLDNAQTFYDWVMGANKKTDNFDSRLVNKINEITNDNMPF